MPLKPNVKLRPAKKRPTCEDWLVLLLAQLRHYSHGAATLFVLEVGHHSTGGKS
jgi:hypothetical protein